MRAYLIGGLRRLEFQESCPVFRFQSNFPVKADAHTMRSAETPVYTENLILFDYVTESPNVNGDDRALLPLPDPVRLAVQVEEPRSMTISAGSIQLPPCSTALLLLDVEGCERILLGVAHPDLLQRPLAFRLLALRQLVQHIGPSTS